MRRLSTIGAVAVLAAAGLASSSVGASALTPPQNAANTAGNAKAPVRAKALVVAQQQAPSAAASLGLAPGERLVVRDAFTDANGARHVRYDRTFKGLRVVGGDLVVHHTATGALKGVDRAGAASAAIAKLTPTVSASAARSTGASLVKASGEKSTAELVVYAAGAKSVLAYDVVTTGVRADQTPTRRHTYVDAASGAVLSSDEEIHTGTGNSIYSGKQPIGTTASGSKFTMVDAEHGGNYTTDLNQSQSGNGTTFTDDDDVWGDGTPSNRQSAGVDAHYGAAATWDFFKSEMGRNGIFDNGKGTRSRVHYGQNYVNAFWDGTQMTYGDGSGNNNPLVSLDVAAHEMSHGVTEATAGLIYTGDAGGLNEATSDIYGSAVEFFTSNPADVGDYLIGERININGNGTPLRYMDKPSKDRRSVDCWSTSTGSLDPHYSSGVGNHFFYLASEGSGAKTINGVSYDSPTCNNSTTTGIGRDAVSKIWYTALKTYMTSTESYPKARNSTIKAAIDLYGASSTECNGIVAAWDAVKVTAGSEKCSPVTTTTSTSTTTSTTTSPTSTTTSPTSTTTTSTPDPGTGYAGMIALNNCSASLARFPGSKGSDKALMLSNGHCYEGGMPKAGEVLVDKPSSRTGTLLNADGKSAGSVQADRLLYATMEGTDVSVYRLTDTYDALRSRTGIDALTIASNHPVDGTAITIPSGYWKQTWNCKINGFVYLLKEGEWTWKDSIRYNFDCQTTHGTSGTPLLDSSRAIVGINNTGNDDNARCTLNNPCEVDENGDVKVIHHQSYGQQTYWLTTCAGTGGAIDLTKRGCMLPGAGGRPTGTPTSTSTSPTSTTTTSTTTSPTSTTTTSTTTTAPPSDNLLKNPGFEEGPTVWSGTTSAINNDSTRPARTGDWKLSLGGNGRTTYQTVSQTVSVPAGGSPKLSFWLRTDTAETSTTTAYDRMWVTVTAGGRQTWLATYSNLDASSDYVEKSFDLSAFKGQRVTVQFNALEDSYRQTSFLIDDTSLTS